MPNDAAERPAQQQPMPGFTDRMQPVPDHGEESYEGHGRLKDKKTIITGADSGIGRAVAIAFAREGADVVISYLCEDEDAQETARLVEEAGRQAVLVRGDLRDPEHCREAIAKTVESFGRIDVLVSNAAYQASFARFEDISEEEWRKTFETNVDAFFYLVKAALPHMEDGGSIIGTTSINADQPSPGLLPYATTKGTIRDFVAGLGQMLADPHPVAIQAFVVDHAVGAGKVNHFKNAKLPLGFAPVHRRQPLLVNANHFTGLHFPQQLRPNDVECAGFGSQHILLGTVGERSIRAKNADHQGSNAVDVTGAQDALGSGDSKAERPLTAMEGVYSALNPVFARVHLLGDRQRNHF